MVNQGAGWRDCCLYWNKYIAGSGFLFSKPSLRIAAMSSKPLGSNTSGVEVTNISMHGFWLLVDGRELFLPFEQFPWFRDASIAAINHIEQPRQDHFHWPELDIDLTLDMIEHPEKYPGVSKS